MHITQINIYPVKSLKGFSRDSALLEYAGFQHDRQWMVVENDGTFITQRTCPQMALVETDVVDGKLVLSSFGMEPHSVEPIDAHSPRLQTDVWDDPVNAVETSADTGDWLSQALGVSCKLVCFPTDETRECNPEITNAGDHTMFSDGYPLLVVSQASLDNLNSKLAEPVGMERFRPNIVVDGCEPHAEDVWKKIFADGIAMRTIKACPRCSVPTVDPQTGVLSGPEPIHTLSSYRRWDGEVFFGMNLVPEDEGMVSVGSEVTVS